MERIALSGPGVGVQCLVAERVHAVSGGIPLNLVQKWLGHAPLTTAAIYADAVGAEEKDIASGMWV